VGTSNAKNANQIEITPVKAKNKSVINLDFSENALLQLLPIIIDIKSYF
jgi:hypothetical protein